MPQSPSQPPGPGSTHIPGRSPEVSRLRAILDATHDAIVAISRDHRIIEANLAMEAIFGYPRESLLGADLDLLLRPSARAQHAPTVARHVHGAPSPVVGHMREIMVAHRDGTPFPITIGVNEIALDGELVFVAVIRDIRREVAHRRELQRSKDELAIQAAINRVLLQSRTAAELLRGVLEAFVTLPELKVERRAGAFLASPARHVLTLTATIGEFEPAFLNAEREVPFGECLCGRAALDRQVRASSDCFTDPDHERRFPLMQPHGHYIIPLLNGDDLVGVIFLYSDAAPSLDDRRRALFETLGIAIGGALRRLEAEAELRASREALLHLATHDPLTGCPNRRLALERLEQELARGARSGVPVTVAILDLDHFKSVNDTHGHLVGDAVLREVSSRLLRALRPYDVCGRYGGEEFIIVLPGSDAETGRAVAERLREAVSEEPIDGAGAELTVRFSAGLATTTMGPDALEAVLRAADDALYRAKALGRDRLEIATEVIGSF